MSAFTDAVEANSRRMEALEGQRNKARRERDQAIKERSELLAAIDAHRDLWEGARPVRNPGLEAIRKQDDALYHLADSIRERETDAA